MEYLVIKWLHIVSSAFLFGTGVGSAFYMLFVSRTRDSRAIAVVVRYVVVADWLFTVPTIVFQPASGFYLAYLAGFPLSSPWLAWSIGLYIVAGACWLPVVWLQIRMRDMAQVSVSNGTEMPALFWRYHRLWTLLGIPAFFALLTVFYLMVAKPV